MAGQAAGSSSSSNKISEEQLARQTALVQLLRDIAVAANESQSVGEAMQFALDRLCAHTGWPVGHVYMLAETDPPQLIPTTLWYFDQPDRFEKFRQGTENTSFAPGEGLPGRVFAAGEAVWIRDITQDANFSRSRLAEDIGVKAGFAFPVRAGADIVAVLEFYAEEAAEPDEQLLEIVTQIGTQLGRVVERQRSEAQLQEREQQLAEAQRIAHLGSWEWEIATNRLHWSDELYRIYGLEPQTSEASEISYESFLERVHPDDRTLVKEAVEQAYQDHQPFSFEHRIVRPDGTIRTLHGRGRLIADEAGQPLKMVGTGQDITSRKEAEEQIQALNADLERRVIERTAQLEAANLELEAEIAEHQQTEEALREEKEIIETVNYIGRIVSAELDLEKTVQAVTDAATGLSGAQFGAFFYNVIDEHGESYTLYTISGVPREAFADFPQPHNTELFGPTFRGEAVIRLDDVRQDPRYGANPPYFGIPEGHLPVTSYLAVPVISRSGEVMGGLFFGHAEAGVFTERAEQLVAGLAAQAAIAMDNARLFNEAQTLNEELELRVEERTLDLQELTIKLEDEIAERKQAEAQVRTLNAELEQRVIERTAELETVNQELELEIRERLRAEEAIKVRARQQAVVAELGQQALSGDDLSRLMDEVVARVAQTLQVEYCKVLELLPDGEALLLRAGIGWQEGLVGRGTVSAGLESQAGYTLVSEVPVIVDDLRAETRFNGPSLLHDHGVVSGMSVVIGSRQQPFGVLGVHTTRRITFTEDDINFLQAAANLLATAIERKRVEEALQLSRDQLSVVLHGAADGITAQDTAGHLVYANDAAARIMGYPSARVLLETPLPEVLRRFEMIDEAGRPFPLSRLPGRLALQGEPNPSAMIRFRVLETGEERWSDVKARPIFNEKGQVELAVNIFQDITELKRSELSQRILAEAAKALAASLDYRSRLTELARLVLPYLADWCIIDVVGEDGLIHRLAVAHVDPAKEELIHQLQRRYPTLDPQGTHTILKVLRSGESWFDAEVTDTRLAAEARDAAHLQLLQQLGFKSEIIVPLVARGRTLGAMTLIFGDQRRRHSLADLALAEELAGRAAMAVDNARLYQAEQKSRAEAEAARQRLEFLAEASNVLASSLDYGVTLKSVAELAVPHMADWCAVDVIEDGRSVRRLAVAHIDPAKVELAHELQERYPFDWNAPSGLARILRTGQPEFYPEIDEGLIEAAARDADHYRILRELNIKSGMGVPLIARGRTLGAISFIWAESGRRYDENDLALARELTQRAALAVDNARLYTAEQAARQQAEGAAERVSRLQIVTAALSGALTSEQVASAIVEHGLETLGVAGGNIMLLNEQGMHLEILCAFGYPPERVETWRNFPMARATPLTDTIRTGEPVFIESTEMLVERYPELGPQQLPEYNAFATLPLTVEGRQIGGIGLSFSRPRSFSQEEQAYMLALARQCAQALERARLYEAEREARAEAEAAQQRLILLTEMRERNRLAQELHDNVAQALGYLNLQLSSISMLLAADRVSEIQDKLNEVKQIVGETYTDVREEIFNLRAKEAAGLGFMETLHRYIEKYRRFYKLDVQLILEAEEALFQYPDEVRMQVVRIIQEALMNVRKHAKVDEAIIRLGQAGDRTRITIEDKGQGFDPQEVADKKEINFGLGIMIERAKTIGAEVEITAAPGQGSQVTILIPTIVEQEPV